MAGPTNNTPATNKPVTAPSAQGAKPATAPGATGAPAAKPAKTPKPVDPAKAAARAAYKSKRATKLTELKTKDPAKFGSVISFKEAKDLKAVTDWKGFCEMKAKAMSDLWLARAAKPQLGEKAIERKKARLQKLKDMIAALEKETA